MSKRAATAKSKKSKGMIGTNDAYVPTGVTTPPAQLNQRTGVTTPPALLVAPQHWAPPATGVMKLPVGTLPLDEDSQGSKLYFHYQRDFPYSCEAGNPMATRLFL